MGLDETGSKTKRAHGIGELVTVTSMRCNSFATRMADETEPMTGACRRFSACKTMLSSTKLAFKFKEELQTWHDLREPRRGSSSHHKV